MSSVLKKPSLVTRFSARIARSKRVIIPNTFALATSAIKGNGVRAYWFNEHRNFGDFITPLLLRHYGRAPIFAMPDKANIVSTGSILEHIDESFSGIILGSGLIYESSYMSFPRANILALRGELTRDRVEGGRDVKLGDPGLLVSKLLIGEDLKKKYKVGFVPHVSEIKLDRFRLFQEKYSSSITVIDVRQSPLEVVHAISHCEHIVSSSLHGLIVADSLSIPNLWMATTEQLVGAEFKFHDYYSSLYSGQVDNIMPITFDERMTLSDLISESSLKPRKKIESLQNDLDVLYRRLR